MLNRSKGPAMYGPRAQADRRAYQEEVKRLVEEQPGLALRQETADPLVETGGDRPRIVGVRVHGEAVHRARAVVLCAGTFMRTSCTMANRCIRRSGGRAATTGISQSLSRLGLRWPDSTERPSRINGRTIDYDKIETSTATRGCSRLPD